MIEKDWRERARLARKQLLNLATNEWESSIDLINRADDPNLFYLDDIRGAYWGLVKDGLLERGEKGVRRRT